MQKAAIEVKNENKKQLLIGSFMLTVGLNPDLEPLIRMFSQQEIDLAIDYLLTKLDSDIPREPFSETSNIELTIRVLLKISEIYKRELETARSLWQLKVRLDRIIDSCSRSQIKCYQGMLQIQVLLLTNLYINALTYGEHLLLVDDSQVEKPSSNCNNCLIKLFIAERRTRLTYNLALAGQ